MTMDLANATCAVTGGGGLIGSFLVDDLVGRGARVIASETRP